jgi:hypothetical protein
MVVPVVTGSVIVVTGFVVEIAVVVSWPCVACVAGDVPVARVVVVSIVVESRVLPFLLRNILLGPRPRPYCTVFRKQTKRRDT